MSPIVLFHQPGWIRRAQKQEISSKQNHSGIKNKAMLKPRELCRDGFSFGPSTPPSLLPCVAKPQEPRKRPTTHRQLIAPPAPLPSHSLLPIDNNNTPVTQIPFVLYHSLAYPLCCCILPVYICSFCALPYSSLCLFVLFSLHPLSD